MKTIGVTGAIPSGTPAIAGPLAYWHLLSLDAPTVATVWTVFIARASRVALPLFAPCAMFLAVWIIYASDRLLDARRARNLEARHRFHGRHRSRFHAGLVVACAALLPLIAAMSAPSLHAYLALGAALLVWLALVHIASKRTARRIPKEIAVGFFFSAAVFLPTVTRAPSLLAPLATAAVFFANLCSLNCLFIYAWEHAHAPNSAHSSTAFGLRRLRPIAAISIVAPLIAIAILPTASIPIATALAAALLLGLHQVRGQFDRITLRALADLALLTPLAILPFMR